MLHFHGKSIFWWLTLEKLAKRVPTVTKATKKAHDISCAFQEQRTIKQG